VNRAQREEVDVALKRLEASRRREKEVSASGGEGGFSWALFSGVVVVVAVKALVAYRRGSRAGGAFLKLEVINQTVQSRIMRSRREPRRHGGGTLG